MIEQLDHLISTTSEEEVKKFIIENFKELPLEFQQEIAVELFTEALDEHIRTLEDIVQWKQSVAAAIQRVYEGKEKI